MEWERPHTRSWRSAKADDAEGMSGKSRDRLAPVLTEASSWTSDRSAQRAGRSGACEREGWKVPSPLSESTPTQPSSVEWRALVLLESGDRAGWRDACAA